MGGGEKRGGVCCFKRRFPSRVLNVWPRELNGFISLGAKRGFREERLREWCQERTRTKKRREG